MKLCRQEKRKSFYCLQSLEYILKISSKTLPWFYKVPVIWGNNVLIWVWPAKYEYNVSCCSLWSTHWPQTLPQSNQPTSWALIGQLTVIWSNTELWLVNCLVYLSSDWSDMICLHWSPQMITNILLSHTDSHCQHWAADNYLKQIFNYNQGQKVASSQFLSEVFPFFKENTLFHLLKQ